MGRSKDDENKRCSQVIRRPKHGDRRWSAEASQAAGRQERRPQTLATRERARGQMQERCERKTEQEVGKQRAVQVFILKKATGGAMAGALPEGARPNRKGPRLPWKQKGRAFHRDEYYSVKLPFIINNILLEVRSTENTIIDS